MRVPFRERATEMGLNQIGYDMGFYQYSDQYGEVIYRELMTSPRQRSEEQHLTDGYITPIMAIFTKRGIAQEEYTYCGVVSDKYQFIGNDVLNERVRQAVREVGMPLLTENVSLSFDLTSMRTELIIQSSQQTPDREDVLPVMVVQNSYNGTKAASLSFGLATYLNSERVVFRFNLGEMRQVHIVDSQTEMTSAVSAYMRVFTENILEMISASFHSTLTDDQMLATLDVIENIGKRRRDEISKVLEEMHPTSEGMPSAWQVFLAITRYSSFEPNLNIKRMLENAAESVLVIPPRMYSVLNQIQSS
jgi:hypothetical protein